MGFAQTELADPRGLRVGGIRTPRIDGKTVLN
jgi:hypothetical protein